MSENKILIHKPIIGHQVALLSILGFWLFYFMIVTLRAAVIDFPAQGEMLMRRVVVTSLGIFLTWCLYLLLRKFEGKPLGTRAAAAFLAAIPCAIAVAAFNYYVFVIYDPASMFAEQEIKEAMEHVSPFKEIAEIAISRYFFLASWASLYLAMSYAAEVRAVERKASRFAQAAQDAELRSLRYQVNPHFLFNTLNSLSTLVMRQKPEEAETMIMNLSTFYRTSLSGDPLDDVTLSEEVRLQKLYLDIEAVRFPKRLKIKIDVPAELNSACVPGLILQPLVENAIKYGVSRATHPVTVAVRAEREGETLVLTVSDDGDVLPDIEDKGSGIGLPNVRDRLDARFNGQASINWRHLEDAGFSVTIRMPLIRNDI